MMGYLASIFNSPAGHAALASLLQVAAQCVPPEYKPYADAASAVFGLAAMHKAGTQAPSTPDQK